MNTDQLAVIQRLVAQRKPIPFDYNGRTHYLNPDASAAYHFENSISKIIRMVQLIDPSASVVYDVGANCGLFAAFAAARLPEASVHAFEPAAELIPIIEMNCEGLAVEVVPQAVGERTEHATLFINPDSQQTNSMNREAVDLFTTEGRMLQQEVLCTSLDDYSAATGTGEVDVLKIDVQGFEGAVFRGARDVMGHVQQLFVESTWMDVRSVTELIPLGLHYGFTHAAVTNSVHMGADVLFSRSPVDAADVDLSFPLTEDLLRSTWF